MTLSRLLIPALAVVVLLGGGCPVPSFNLTKVHPLQPSGKMAFGKIGGMMRAGGETISYRATNEGATGSFTAPASGVAMEAKDSVGTVSLMVDPSVPGSMPRPMPPVPQRFATVEYVLPEVLPSWGEEGDVIKFGRVTPNAGTVKAFVKDTGLPSSMVQGVSEVTNMNIQWKGRDGMWSYDVISPAVNFWLEHQEPYEGGGSPLKMPPDRTQAIAIADSFLDSHGFNAIKARGGVMEPSPWEVMPMGGGATGVAYPCLMERSAVDGTAMSEPAQMTWTAAAPMPPSAPDAPVEPQLLEEGQEGVMSDVAPAIWPSPCGWDYSQVTVTYPETRDGQSVVHVGGYPAPAGSVTVDLRNKRVSSVSLMLDRPSERSAYPLIDAATAKRRLQAGGLNPVWPYSDSGSIKVMIEKVELVWLRHESWKGGSSQTFDLPALLATGNVERGDKDASEPYRTVVPLLTDDALDESIDWEGGSGGVPVPFPMPVDAQEAR